MRAFPTFPQLVFKPGMTHTSVLTLEYMAPLRTSPLRIQMIEAAGLALSAWQVRLSGSPARRLTTGPPLMTGFSGGTIDAQKERAISHTITILLGNQYGLCSSHKIWTISKVDIKDALIPFFLFMQKLIHNDSGPVI